MSGKLAIGRLLAAGLIVVAALCGQDAPALAMLAIINGILAVLAVTETRARIHRHADAW